MRRQFEVDAIALLRRDYPVTTSKHADDALQLFVRHGIERARASRHGQPSATSSAGCA